MTSKIQNISNNYNNSQSIPQVQAGLNNSPDCTIQSQPIADTVQFGQQATSESRKNFFKEHRSEMIVGGWSVLPAVLISHSLFFGILIGAGVATIAGLTKGKIWGKTDD